MTSYVDGGDGSFYELNDQGFATAAVDQYGNYFPEDAREAAKLDQYVTRPEGDDRPWWERVADYGLTRAIDAQFGPTAINKTGAGGTFAGQNGRTYRQVGSNGAPVQQNMGGGMLPLIVAAGIAIFALAS